MKIRAIDNGLIEVVDAGEYRYYAPWTLARAGFVDDKAIARAILQPNTYFPADKPLLERNSAAVTPQMLFSM